MKQEYVIKAAYYKGKIDAIEELVKTVNGFVSGSDETVTTVEMYRAAVMNLKSKILYQIGEIKLDEPTR